MPRPAVIALTGLVLTPAAAGCGGEPGRAPRTATPPPSAVTVQEPRGSVQVTDPARRAFIRRADHVCEALDPQRERTLEGTRGGPDPVASYGRSVDLAAEQLRRIERIPAPKPDRRLIQVNVIDRLSRRLELRRRLLREVRGGDEAGAARDQAELEAEGIAVHGFARGYGFKWCGVR